MKNKIDYKKIYEDIKNNKLYDYYNNYINDKSEKNVRLYVLGSWCNQLLKGKELTEKEYIVILKNTNKLLQIRIE